MALEVTSGVGIDWDPRSPDVLADQVRAYDAMRARCPVAHGVQGNWTVFGHADTVRMLEDHETFSNVVSVHVAIPNGMDPPQHTAYRHVVERYFTAERVAAFEPVCRVVATESIARFVATSGGDVMADLAEPFANALACAFMGWPSSMHEPLREWTRKSHRATLAMDRDLLSQVALEFDGHIREQLELRRALVGTPPDDATTMLLAETVDGRPLADEEIVAIVRNWTVGELGTIAASVGILIEFFATHPDVVGLLRGDSSLIDDAVDEILRIHAPLVSNRRRTTRPVTVADREIPEGERVLVLWASANRDERVFSDPDEFRLDRDPGDNLLYGRGIHVCPGAPLARCELRVLVEELLAAVERFTLLDGGRREFAHYPAGGFAVLDVVVAEGFGRHG